MNSSDTFMTTLGLARKAGKLVIGWDRIEKYKGPVSFIIAAGDASERTCLNAGKKAETVVTDYTMAELGSAVGIKRAALIAVTDPGFAFLLNNRIKLKNQSLQ